MIGKRKAALVALAGRFGKLFNGTLDAIGNKEERRCAGTCWFV